MGVKMKFSSQSKVTLKLKLPQYHSWYARNLLFDVP